MAITLVALMTPDGARAGTVTATSDQGGTTVTATTPVETPECVSPPLTTMSDQSLSFTITCTGMDTPSISTTIAAGPVLGDLARDTAD